MTDKIRQWLPAALLGGLLSFAYFPTIVWMVDRWGAKDSYFGHGFLIPFVSLYLAWHKRGELSRIQMRPSFWGLGLLVVGLFIHLVSAILKVYFTSAFSILLSVAGLVLYLGGKKLLRALAFPILFLLFMVPFPLVVIGTTTVRLKLFAALCATKVLHLIGFLAVQKGSTIYLKNATLQVDDPCSGLRSLLSLVTLGVLFAYFKKTTFPKKTLFFFSSIPIAVLANVVRIVLLALIADIYGVEIALKFFHDVSGYLLFAVALAGLSFIGRILQ